MSSTFDKSSSGESKAVPETPKPSGTYSIPALLERGIDQVEQLLASGNNVILDFRGCTFITVAGIEWLEEILLRAQSAQVSVQFINLRPTVYKVFKVAHIDSLLKACGAPGPTGRVCELRHFLQTTHAYCRFGFMYFRTV